MNQKVISIILVGASSLASLFFVIKGEFELAVLFLTLMFTFSNFFRSLSFAKDGLEKEAKWMKKMSLVFAVLTVIVFFVVINS